jgi:hypothetical protein
LQQKLWELLQKANQVVGQQERLRGEEQLAAQQAGQQLLLQEQPQALVQLEALQLLWVPLHQV